MDITALIDFAPARKDLSGNLWVFGGLGYDSTGINGHLGDI
jgi:hypothetical protein